MKKLLGLIGNPLEHSLSQVYFEKKFTEEGIENVEYKLFPLPSIEHFSRFLEVRPQLAGFNVTIPYKEKIIPFLDDLSDAAKESGAVNTVVVQRRAGQVRLTGYNTDIYGFRESIVPQLENNIKYKALILGAGGAAKAAKIVLRQINIPFKIVHRTKEEADITYNELTGKEVKQHLLIINATPLGMYPDTETFPSLPYGDITENHLLFDMVYNPTKTKFLEKGGEKGAKTCNGLQMLYAQAERAWETWNSEHNFS